MYSLDRSEIEFLRVLVNERIIQADKEGVPYDHPSSVFRERLLNKLLASEDMERADGRLYASNQEGKWYLTAEGANGDYFVELEWPKAWPKELTADQLRQHGFEVV